MTGPIDAELFARTAPAWNCVAYPLDGMHLLARGGGCLWCGASRLALLNEERAREVAAALLPLTEEQREKLSLLLNPGGTR